MSSSKLVPENPSAVMVIRKVTDNITTLSVPFQRFGLINMGGRGTLVRLPSGSVAVFSPVALTPEVKETVSKMGELKYIIANDFEHHIFIGDWHDAYPSAKVLGPEGLPEKRAKQKNPRVPFSTIYRDQPSDVAPNGVGIDAEFDAAFDSIFVPAHANKELVYNFRPDRTLIEADLLFNAPAHEQMSRTGLSPTAGVLTRLFNALAHTRGAAMGQRRAIWYGTSAKDRPGFARSMQHIAAWDFDRIIPAHGDVIESGGKQIFNKIMAWHLETSQKAQ